MFDYSIAGVSSSLQFALQGPIISGSSSQFTLYASNGTTLLPVLIASPTASNHAVPKTYVDTVVGSSSGTYVANGTAHYVSTATSVINSINLLDSSLYTVTTSGVGLGSSGVFAPNLSAHYIASSTSVVNSTNLLDSAIYSFGSGITAINSGVGLVSGTYVPPTSNYLGSTTSVLTALTVLDGQIFSINSLSLGSRVSSLETFQTSTTNTDNQQNTYITNINNSAGFSSTGTLSGYTSTNFISSSDSLAHAIGKLDNEAQVLSSSMSSLNSTVSTLNSSFGSPGTYTKVTTDSHGRVISGTNIASSDVTTALGYSPNTSAVSVYDQLITTTSSTLILTISPTKLNVLVNVFYRVASTTNVSISVVYVDNSGTSQTVSLVNTSETSGNYSVGTFINIQSGSAINVYGIMGTANAVYVSASALPQ